MTTAWNTGTAAAPAARAEKASSSLAGRGRRDVVAAVSVFPNPLLLPLPWRPGGAVWYIPPPQGGLIWLSWPSAHRGKKRMSTCNKGATRDEVISLHCIRRVHDRVSVEGSDRTSSFPSVTNTLPLGPPSGRRPAALPSAASPASSAWPAPPWLASSRLTALRCASVSASSFSDATVSGDSRRPRSSFPFARSVGASLRPWRISGSMPWLTGVLRLHGTTREERAYQARPGLVPS